MPLVCFGHMHEGLKGSRRLRNMAEISAAIGTVYLNAAVVPRVRMLRLPGSSEQEQPRDVTARHFVVVELCGGAVTSASNVWLAASSSREGGFEAVLEQPLLQTLPALEGDDSGLWLRRRVWRGHERAWETVASPARPHGDATGDAALAAATLACA